MALSKPGAPCTDRRIDLNPCFGQIPLEQTLLSLKAEIRTCRCGMAEW